MTEDGGAAMRGGLRVHIPARRRRISPGRHPRLPAGLPGLDGATVNSVRTADAGGQNRRRRPHRSYSRCGERPRIWLVEVDQARQFPGTMLWWCRCSGGRWSAPSPFIAGGAAIQRQADRFSHQLRCPGHHRDREHAAVQRAAARTEDLPGVTAAADRDRGSASVMSRSKFELEPVVQGDVETAVRICGAEFGKCCT